jgi:hypothetical protein
MLAVLTHEAEWLGQIQLASYQSLRISELISRIPVETRPDPMDFTAGKQYAFIRMRALLSTPVLQGALRLVKTSQACSTVALRPTALTT